MEGNMTSFLPAVQIPHPHPICSTIYHKPAVELSYITQCYPTEQRTHGLPHLLPLFFLIPNTSCLLLVTKSLVQYTFPHVWPLLLLYSLNLMYHLERFLCWDCPSVTFPLYCQHSFNKYLGAIFYISALWKGWTSGLEWPRSSFVIRNSTIASALCSRIEPSVSMLLAVGAWGD
jgi:hypothetical protein